VKVALVVEVFGPGSGGVETVGWHLARELALRGVRLTVLCRRCTAAPPPALEVHRVRVPSFWQPLRVLLFSGRAASATRSGFELVHSLSRTRHQNLYRAGGGSHAAYMEQVYGLPGLRARLSPRHRMLLRIEEAVFRDPEQVIQCNAKGTAREIAGRYGIPDTRLVTIYNGVDTDRFHPEQRGAARESVRAELKLGGPTALFVGSGFHRKGLDRAIRGLARGAPSDAVLVVAGDGDPTAYRRLARELEVDGRVLFVGHRADIERLHAAADLFVLPTRYDPFSNASIEAMASGLAVATTGTNGASEVIDSGQNGLVLDGDGFQAAFALLETPERLEQMGEAARVTAERHTWARHAEEVLQLYERIAG
jgi:UDP-glucose:(heptosyl)LPS alpha-1,3-glucosyltransferase